MKPLSILCLVAAAWPHAAFAQTPTLEFTAGAGNPTTAQGAVSSQVITFQNNTNNPTGNTFAAFNTPTTTATISVGNYQYTLTPQAPTTHPLMIGVTNSSTPVAVPVNIFNLMSTVGGASDPLFTSALQNAGGTGITQSVNEAVYMYTSAMGMYNGGQSTTGRYYIGDLTITFSNYLTNPVLHLIGMGASDGALGLTTELELQTPGLTLSVLSGSSELTVSGGTKILNGATHPGSATGSGAASGSVLVTGTNIITMLFKVFIRADGGSASWTAGPHVGDAWMIGVSVPTSQVTVLPITLASFNATLQGAKTQLQWTTDMEENTSFFEIESNSNGRGWQSLGMVMAAGNSNTPRTYTYTDVNTVTGNDAYRIKEVDVNGNASYSQVRAVNLGENSQTKVYPNPVKDLLYIAGNSGVMQSVILSNTGGQVLSRLNNPVSGTSIDMHLFPTGMYLVTIRYASGQTETTKIFKN